MMCDRQTGKVEIEHALTDFVPLVTRLRSGAGGTIVLSSSENMP